MDDPCNSVLRFAGFFGFRGEQIVDAGSSVRIQHCEWLGLLLKVRQQQAQHRVLKYLGVVTCVKGVPIIFMN